MANIENNNWWDKKGDFKVLHKINDLRTEFILNNINKSVKGKQVLDIGCGGGLVSEPLAKLGGKITAIDENFQNLKEAKSHAKESKLKINYVNSNFESFYRKNSKKYDLILCLEVIEHIDNVKETLEKIAKIIQPGGILILSTINRNIKSLLFAKIFAEYILNWIPIGTHEFKKFLKPSEIINILKNSNLKIVNLKGLQFNPVQNQWNITNNTNINYFLVAKK